MEIKKYDRKKAVAYAHKWAFGRNPAFYDFSELGGDCTNFASQVLYAGSGVMNYTPTLGWYYIDLNNRAPAWTGVNELYRFLISNTGPAVFAKEVTINEIEDGDLIQLSFSDRFERSFEHTPVVVNSGMNTPSTVLVAAHTYDADNRPLSTYNYKKIRFLHILGYRE